MTLSGASFQSVPNWTTTCVILFVILAESPDPQQSINTVELDREYKTESTKKPMQLHPFGSTDLDDYADNTENSGSSSKRVCHGRTSLYRSCGFSGKLRVAASVRWTNPNSLRIFASIHECWRLSIPLRSLRSARILEEVCFHDCPRYEAFSYTWIALVLSHFIKIDGRVLRVTASCGGGYVNSSDKSYKDHLCRLCMY